ncbi:MAG: hypothetical protein H0X31_20715 [Nostocaceae cyanobacterium]|nr:hypothetical protein [Nostocaceae cyanobacterium]
MPKSIQGFKGAIHGFVSLLQAKFKQIWHRPQTLGFEKYVPTESRHSGMVHKWLNEDLTQQLVKVCKQEKTTVQGALCAALMFAAAKRISDDNRSNVRLSCCSYISLRKRLQPKVTEENMGLLASSVTSFHTLGVNTAFWNLAREVKQQLEVGLERNDIFSIMLMSRKIVESILAHPNQVTVSVAITNIGQVNIPQVYGLFKLEEISFVTALAAFGCVFSAAVSTFRGKMLLNFMFSEPSISHETMEKLANNAISHIVNACCQENCVSQL